jgi:hypothetical protein
MACHIGLRILRPVRGMPLGSRIIFYVWPNTPNHNSIRTVPEQDHLWTQMGLCEPTKELGLKPAELTIPK